MSLPRSLEFRVGFFVLLAFLLLAYMASRLTQDSYWLKGSRTYFALVDDTIGLPKTASVKVAGIDIGRMKGKKLEGTKARLELIIREDVTVHADAHLAMKAIGYLGDRYLELHPGTPAQPPLAERAVIPTTQGPSLEQMMDRSSALLDTWNQVGRSLKAILGG